MPCILCLAPTLSDNFPYLFDDQIRRMQGPEERDGDELPGPVPQTFPEGVNHVPQVHLREEDILHLMDQRANLPVRERPEGLQTEEAHVCPPPVPEFLDRFAVVGPTQSCVERLRELAGTGLSKLVLTGASFDANRDEALRSRALLEREVLPALRGR